nr:DUF1549 domain-containing protein [Thermoanaerobaculia bacterium]
KASVAAVDAAFRKEWDGAKLTPADPAPDLAVARRLALGLMGTIPSLEEIRQFIGADSLAYLSLEGLLGCASGERKSYCTACWTGEYRVPVDSGEARQVELFPIRMERT